MILVSSAKGIGLDRERSTGGRPLMYARKTRDHVRKPLTLYIYNAPVPVCVTI